MSFSTGRVEQPDSASAPPPVAPSTVRDFRRSGFLMSSDIGAPEKAMSWLVVTRGAVPRHLALDVTADAPAHVVHVVHLEHLRHAGHVAVTGRARAGAECLDVLGMREMDVPREEVDPRPFDGLLLVEGLLELRDLGAVGAVAPADDGVAAHAGLQRGNAGLRSD